MANIPPIQFKRSHDAGAQPTSGQLAVGEIAINMADAKLWTKDSDGNIISLGGGGAVAGGGDSDIVIILDSDGGQTGTEAGAYEINVITVDRDNDTWQNNSTIRAVPDGARINVFRRRNENSLWTISTDTNTRTSWDGSSTGNCVAGLSYGSNTSYAFCSSSYNDNFRLELAYSAAGDHASLAKLNGYFIWQHFPTPVSIGNGTNLGTFKNGRASGEYHADTSVEFYDVNGDLITSQSFTGQTSVATRTINVSGSITGVRSVIFRGDNGNSLNPAFNSINLYVGGSTAYPTTSWASDQKWGGGWKNIGSATSPNPSNEVMALCHIQSTGAILTGAASSTFGSGDWCVNNTVDPSPIHIWWFNKPWAIAGGTFTNGRTAFVNQYHTAADLEYFSATATGDDNLLFSQSYTYSNAYQTITYPNCRGVTKIQIETSSLSAIHGASMSVNRPGLVIPSSEETSITVIDEPEVWVKTASAAVSNNYYAEGVRGALSPFTKISS